MASNKKFEISKFNEGVVDKIKRNSALCDVICKKINTDVVGLSRMLSDNSQRLMHFFILKDISSHLKIKIEKLAHEIEH